MTIKRPQATPSLHPLTLLATTLLSLSTTGCLAIGMAETTEFQESAQLSVRFASPGASSDFYTGLRESNRETYTDAETFIVPFLVAGRRERYHQTAHYNAEVRLADTDGNGEITDAEARAYLAARRSGAQASE